MVTSKFLKKDTFQFGTTLRCGLFLPLLHSITRFLMSGYLKHLYFQADLGVIFLNVQFLSCLRHFCAHSQKIWPKCVKNHSVNLTLLENANVHDDRRLKSLQTS